eukprot:evm.model.scf_665.5 EVM.evm.TU.scf_665.5   scf_665:38896-43254(-)
MLLANSSLCKAMVPVHASMHSSVCSMHRRGSQATRRKTHLASLKARPLQFVLHWSPKSAFGWRVGHIAKQPIGGFRHFAQKEPSDVKIEFDDDKDLLDDADKDMDFDDIELDDEYYKSLGMTKEQAAEEQASLGVEYADPEGFDLTLENLAKLRPDVNENILKALQNQKVFGPPVALLAGFKVEELPVVRVLLDSAGGHAVKVVPVKADMMAMHVRDAVHLPEPDWEKPRPENFTLGGGWGSQRVIVFGGVRVEAQAAVVELLEESGLPPVCVGVAAEETQDMLLGELLAEAVKMQRGRKNPDKQIWDTEGHVSNRLPNLQDFLQNEIKERVSSISEALESGKLELEEDDGESVLQVPLGDIIPDDVPRDQVNVEELIKKATGHDGEFAIDGFEQEHDSDEGDDERMSSIDPEPDAEDAGISSGKGQEEDPDECKGKFGSGQMDLGPAGESNSLHQRIENRADDGNQAPTALPGELDSDRGATSLASEPSSLYAGRMEADAPAEEVVRPMCGSENSQHQDSEVSSHTSGAVSEGRLNGDGAYSPEQSAPMSPGIRNDFTLIDDLVEGLASHKDTGVAGTGPAASGKQQDSQEAVQAAAGQEPSQVLPRESVGGSSEDRKPERAVSASLDGELASSSAEAAIDAGVQNAPSVGLDASDAGARKESQSDASAAPPSDDAPIQDANGPPSAQVFDDQNGMDQRKSLNRNRSSNGARDSGVLTAGAASALDPRAAIQSALASGADPEALKRMIDDMAGGSSGVRGPQPMGARGMPSARPRTRPAAIQRRKPVRRFVSRKDVSSIKTSKSQDGQNRRSSSPRVVPMDISDDEDLAGMAEAFFGLDDNGENDYGDAGMGGQGEAVEFNDPEYEEWLKKVAKWEAQGLPLDVDSLGEAIKEDIENSSPDSPESVARARNMTVKELREYADKQGMAFTTMLKDVENSGIELDAE